MPDSSETLPAAQKQLFDQLLQEFSARLVSVVETMAGERPALQLTPVAAAEETAGGLFPGGLLWKQPLSGLEGAFWISASESDWTTAGTHILRAAGLGPEDTDAESIRSSYLETLSQALGGLAQHLSKQAGREVTPVDGKAVDNKTLDGKAVEADNSAPADTVWGSLTLTLGENPAKFAVGMEPSLLSSLLKLQSESQGELLNQPQPGASQSLVAGNSAGDGENANMIAAGKSKTFDLLLDVELPVSVSFGSAEVSLKDVLKLTTGSIVELNRSILEPVEVVVNNCVIARGEVVVVEGNFGVRIQSVASRQERLRTVR